MRRWSCCCHVCTGPKLTFNCSLSRLEILTLAMCPESGAAPGVPGPCRPGAGQGWVTTPVVTGPSLGSPLQPGAALRELWSEHQRKRPSRGSLADTSLGGCHGLRAWSSARPRIKAEQRSVCDPPPASDIITPASDDLSINLVTG